LKGCQNIGQLKQVIDNASLPVILGSGSAMEMDIDFKFLIISEGRSLFSVIFSWEFILWNSSVIAFLMEPMF
jgi:hypothetical protein